MARGNCSTPLPLGGHNAGFFPIVLWELPLFQSTLLGFLLASEDAEGDEGIVRAEAAVRLPGGRWGQRVGQGSSLPDPQTSTAYYTLLFFINYLYCIFPSAD